jgi:hypothetical protein
MIINISPIAAGRQLEVQAIGAADVDPDYTIRPEPSRTVEKLLMMRVI